MYFGTCLMLLSEKFIKKPSDGVMLGQLIKVLLNWHPGLCESTGRARLLRQRHRLSGRQRHVEADGELLPASGGFIHVANRPLG